MKRALTLLALFLLFGASGALSAVPSATDPVPDDPDPLLAGLSEAEILRLGERMYRDGILPSGEIMIGYIHGDIEVDGGAFSCESCHLRAGLGSYEGGVETPPTTGRELYRPYYRPPSLHDVDLGGRYIYAKTIQQRPAYTRDALKYALRFGEDPAGVQFNEVMPRYPLGDRDMAILVRYLELLSREFSPGASPTNFRFATIITDDVDPAERKALLERVERFIYEQNQQVGMYRKFIKTGYTPTGDMKYAFHSASLKVWELAGPPDTWQRQLADYLERDRVLAVLGGISNQSWQPIHDFCEAQRLPCLYPITNLPVVSDDDWYTFYFNKGYYQEGEAAARFFWRRKADARVLQLIQNTPASRALAAGFAAGRSELGLPLSESLTVDAAGLDDLQTLADQLAKRRPEVLLVWGDAELISALSALLGEDASRLACVSSSLAGRALLEIPDLLRERVYITWPFRLKPFIGDEEGTGKLASNPIKTTWQSLGAPRIASRTATMLEKMVTVGLRDLENDLFRDNLLDVLSTQMDRVVFDYERLSFGPGQRYSSKGCYLMQLGPGPKPELIPRSDWVIH